MEACSSLIQLLEDGCVSSQSVEQITKSLVKQVLKELSCNSPDKILSESQLLEKLLDATQYLVKHNRGCFSVLEDVGFLAVISNVLDILKRGATEENVYDDLKSLMELAVETVLAISDMSSQAKSAVVFHLLPSVLQVLTIDRLPFLSRLEILKTINTMLEQCHVQTKSEFLKEPENQEKIKRLIHLIQTVGDYEFQVGMVECLMRMFPRKARRQYADMFITDKHIHHGFLNIKDKDFETDCRQFLNAVNAKSEDPNQGVYSIPCLTVLMGNKELRKPSDISYSDFWVDFNIGSQRVTIFCEQDSLISQTSSMDDDMWETVAIYKSDVHKCFCTVEDDQVLLLEVDLKSPVCDIYPSQHQDVTDNKIRIQFDINLEMHVSHAIAHTFSTTELAEKKVSKVSTVEKPLQISIKDVELSDSQTMVSASPSVSGRNHQASDSCSQESSSTRRHKVSIPSVPMCSPLVKPNEVKDSREKNVSKSKNPAQSKACSSVHVPKEKNEEVNKIEKKNRKTKSDFVVPKTPLVKNTRSKGKVKTPLVMINKAVNREQEKSKGTQRKQNKEAEDDSNHTTSTAAKDETDVVIPDSLPIQDEIREKLIEQAPKVSMSIKLNEDSGIGEGISTTTVPDTSFTSKPSSDLQKPCQKNKDDEGDESSHEPDSQGDNNRTGQLNDESDGEISDTIPDTYDALDEPDTITSSNKMQEKKKENLEEIQQAMSQSFGFDALNDDIDSVPDSLEKDYKNDEKIEAKEGRQSKKGVKHNKKNKEKHSSKRKTSVKETDTEITTKVSENVDVSPDKRTSKQSHNKISNIPDSLDENDENNTTHKQREKKGKKKKDQAEKKPKESSKRKTDTLQAGLEARLAIDDMSETIALTKPTFDEISDSFEKQGEHVKVEAIQKYSKGGNLCKRQKIENESSTVKTSSKGTGMVAKNTMKAMSDNLQEEFSTKSEGKSSCKQRKSVSFGQNFESLQELYDFELADKSEAKVHDPKDIKCNKKNKHLNSKNCSKELTDEKVNQKISHKKQKDEKVRDTCLENEKTVIPDNDVCHITSSKLVNKLSVPSKRSLRSTKKQPCYKEVDESFTAESENNEDLVSSETGKQKTEKGKDPAESMSPDKYSIDVQDIANDSLEDSGDLIKGDVETECSKPLLIEEELVHIGDEKQSKNKTKHHSKKKSQTKQDKRDIQNQKAISIPVKNKKEDLNTSAKDTSHVKTDLSTVVCDKNNSVNSGDSNDDSMSDCLYVEADDSYNARRYRQDVARPSKSTKNESVYSEKKLEIAKLEDFDHYSSKDEMDSSQKNDEGKKTKSSKNKGKCHKEAASRKGVKVNEEKVNRSISRHKNQDKEAAENASQKVCVSYKSKVGFKDINADDSQSKQTKSNAKCNSMVFQMSYSKSKTSYRSYDWVGETHVKKEPYYDPYDFEAQWENASMQSEKQKRLVASKESTKKDNSDSKKREKSKNTEKRKNSSVSNTNYEQSYLDASPEPQDDVKSEKSSLLVQDKETKKWHRKNNLPKQQKGNKKTNLNTSKNIPEMGKLSMESPSSVPNSNDVEIQHDLVIEEEQMDLEEPLHVKQVNSFNKILKDLARSAQHEETLPCKSFLQTPKSLQAMIDEVCDNDSNVQTPCVSTLTARTPNLGSFGRSRGYKPLNVCVIKTPQSVTIKTPKSLPISEKLDTESEDECRRQSKKTARKQKRKKKPVSYMELSDSVSEDEYSLLTSRKSRTDNGIHDNSLNISAIGEKSWIDERQKNAKKEDGSKTYRRQKSNTTSRRPHNTAEEESVDEKSSDNMSRTDSRLHENSLNTSVIGEKSWIVENQKNAKKKDGSKTYKRQKSNLMSRRPQSSEEESEDEKSSDNMEICSLTMPSVKSSQLASVPVTPSCSRRQDYDDVSLILSPITPYRLTGPEDDIQVIQTQEKYNLSLNMDDVEDQSFEECNKVLQQQFNTLLGDSGFASGPSSEARPSRSTMKRKFPKSESELSLIESDSQSEHDTSTFVPKKLFKSETKDPFKTALPHKALSIYSDQTEETELDFPCQTGVSSFLATFGADIQKQFKTRRQRLESLTKDTLRASQGHFRQAWQNQLQHQSTIHEDYMSKILVELNEMGKDIDHLKQAETKTEEFFKQQLTVLRTNEQSQRSRMENMRRAHVDYRGSVSSIRKHGHNVHKTMVDQLRKGMSGLQKKLLQDVQKQELMNVRRGLQNLF